MKSWLRKEINRGKIISLEEWTVSFSGFTNIVTRPDQYIVSTQMESWWIGSFYLQRPGLTTCRLIERSFYLNAHMRRFRPDSLEWIDNPLAFAKIESGKLDDFTFSTEASAKELTSTMLSLPRPDELFKKNMERWFINKVFITPGKLVVWNMITDHPEKGKAYTGSLILLTIERDPYHSTFNYLWQILRPPLIKVVGCF